MTRHEISSRADALRTLLVFTALHAFLLTVNLHLLPMGSGEARTLNYLEHPNGQAPLYFLLAHAWLKLTGIHDQLFGLRWLSALFAIAATILFDRLWLRKAPTEMRDWALPLWAFSPCLLLFGRMAQPYSLQAMLIIVGVWGVLHFAAEYTSWKRIAALAASLLPLTMTLKHWDTSESALKVGCGFYSLAFGEAIPIWLLLFSALLAVPYLWVLIAGARTRPQWLPAAAMLLLLACIGAANFVILLPLAVLALSAGIQKLGRIGAIFGIALFAADAGGVWSYFETRDILNIEYIVPNRQIAANIAFRSTPADTLILVDGLTMDDTALAYYLPASFPVRVLRTPADADAAWTALQGNSGIRHVWFLRSPNAFDTLEQRMMGAWYTHTLHPYVPASATYRAALKYAMHIAQPPAYLYEAWEFRR